MRNRSKTYPDSSSVSSSPPKQISSSNNPIQVSLSPTSSGESERRLLRSKDSYIILIIIALICKFLLIPSYFSTDFDVHRNWLAITHSLPISKWYYEDTSEWTLDYPPFFAYFEWILSQFAQFVDKNMVQISKKPYQSKETILFQRISVIFTDFLFIYGAYFFCKYGKFNSSITRVLIFAIVVLNPGLLIVDNIHFQYNGILFGLLLLSWTNIFLENDLLAGIFFAIVLNFKHLFLSLAPIYFIYLLRHYCFMKGRFHLFNFLALGSSVLFIFALSLGYFVYLGQLPQLLSRLFPFARGLCHAYWAPNFWVFYNMLDKLLVQMMKFLHFPIPTLQVASFTGGLVTDSSHIILPSIRPIHCTLLTLIFLIPMLIKLWKQPTPLVFLTTIVQSSLTFFLFGWHVHEKAILVSIIPLWLLAPTNMFYGRMAFILSTTGHYSLFPLLFKPTEIPTKILLLLLHSVISLISLHYLHFQEQRLSISNQFNSKEKLYLFGFLAIEAFSEFIHPLFLKNSYPFLGLLVISIYCTIGVFYTYFKLYQSLLQL